MTVWEDRAWLVRVHRQDGSISGTGFAVAPDLIATCAHVVGAPDPLPDPVVVSFPMLDDRKVTATVLKDGWSPPRSTLGDTALLGLDKAVPGLVPLPVAAPHSMRGQTFISYGFPKHYDDGVETVGSIGGLVGKEWVQLEVDSALSVQPGFSGAPVWSVEVGAVVAVLTNRDGVTDGRVAFGVPIEKFALRSTRIAQLSRSEAGEKATGREVEPTGFFKATPEQDHYVDMPLLPNETILLRQAAARPGIGGQLVVTTQRILWRPISLYKEGQAPADADRRPSVLAALSAATHKSAPPSQLDVGSAIAIRAGRSGGLFHPPSVVLTTEEGSEVEIGILDAMLSSNRSRKNVVARDRVLAALQKALQEGHS